MLCYYNQVVSSNIRVWRSLVSRLNGVQEASGSNLDTRTKKAERALALSAFFFCGEIRTIKCECPVDIRLLPAGRQQLLNLSNLDTRPPNSGTPLLFWIFSFLRDEIRTIKCECPVDIRLLLAGRQQLLNLPNLDTHKNNKSRHSNHKTFLAPHSCRFLLKPTFKFC